MNKNILAAIISSMFGSGQSAPTTANTMLIGVNGGWSNSYSGGYLWADICRQGYRWWRFEGTGTATQFNGRLYPSNNTDVWALSLADSGTNPITLPAGTYTVLNPSGSMIGVGSWGGQNYVGWTTATSASFTYDPATHGNIYLYAKGTVEPTSGPIQIIRPDCAASYAAGNPFSPEFIAYHTALKENYIRFLDWNVASFNLETNWSDRATPQTQQNGIVPWEYIIDACNRLGKDAWINIPHRATQDYVNNLAALFAVNLDPDRHVYVEGHGNEVWNSAFDWVGGTWWTTYMDSTKRTAAADFAGNRYTLVAHGLTDGQAIQCLPSTNNHGLTYSIENTNYTGSYGWETILGMVQVLVLDADHFQIYAYETINDVPNTLVELPVEKGRVDLLFVDPVQNGLNDLNARIAALNANYAKTALRNWAAFDAALGRSRVSHIMGFMTPQPSTYLASRLAYPGALAATDYVACCPYIGAPEVAAKVTSDGSAINVGVWVSEASYANGVTGVAASGVAVAVFPATKTNVVISDVLNGTGAVAHYSGNITLGNGTYSPALTCSITSDQQYKVAVVYFSVAQDVLLVESVTASPGLSHMMYQSFADYRDAVIYAIMTDKKTQFEEILKFTQGKGVVAYECGYGSISATPTECVARRSAFQNSPEIGQLIATDVAFNATMGLKMYSWYADVAGSVFRLADNYGDYNNVKTQALAAYNGSKAGIAETFPVVSEVVFPIITTEPASYPHVIGSLGPAGLTYKITRGNYNGNYSIQGNQLVMVNKYGLDFSVPSPVNLTISASSGTFLSYFPASTFIGDSWYPADAIYAWSSIDENNTAAIHSTVGTALDNTFGSGATLSGGLFDMDGNVYMAQTAMTRSAKLSQPLLVAHVIDLDNQSVLFSTLAQVGIGAFVSFYINLQTARPVINFWLDSISGQVDTTASDLTGKHVIWGYWDGVDTWTAGHDQVSVGTLQSAGLASKTLGVPVIIGGNAATSSMSAAKQGSMVVVNRNGMTLSDAKGFVGKLQSKHGIE